MGGDFYGFDMHYHDICGYRYTGYDYKDTKFRDLEKKGYYGFTVSDTSRWEMREIRRWIKKQSAYIYLSLVEEYHTTDNDGYQDNGVCLWFSKKGQKERFIKFLERLPKREFTIDFDNMIFDVELAFKKDQLKANRRLVYRDECVTATFDDAADAMAFKLRWL